MSTVNAGPVPTDTGTSSSPRKESRFAWTNFIEPERVERRSSGWWAFECAEPKFKDAWREYCRERLIGKRDVRYLVRITRKYLADGSTRYTMREIKGKQLRRLLKKTLRSKGHELEIQGPGIPVAGT